MASIELQVEKRDPAKIKAKKLRRDGKIPGVYYINGTESIPITSNSIDLRPIVFTSLTRLVNVKIDGDEERECILKDVTFDPITDEIVHFDLMGVTQGHKLTVTIPISLVGDTPVGVKNGGILNHVLRKVKVRCLPKDLIESIEVDVSDLAIGDYFTLDKVDLGELEIESKENAVIAAVTRPRVLKEAVEPTEAEEPELIGEEKDEDEEGEEGEEEGEEKSEDKE